MLLPKLESLLTWLWWWSVLIGRKTKPTTQCCSSAWCTHRVVKEVICPFLLASCLPKSLTLLFWVSRAVVVWPTLTLSQLCCLSVLRSPVSFHTPPECRSWPPPAPPPHSSGWGSQVLGGQMYQARWWQQAAGMVVVLGAFLSLPFPFLLPGRAHLDLVKVVAAGEVMVLVLGAPEAATANRFMLRRCYWKQWMIWFIIPNQLTWQQCDWERKKAFKIIIFLHIMQHTVVVTVIFHDCYCNNNDE